MGGHFQKVLCILMLAGSVYCYGCRNSQEKYEEAKIRSVRRTQTPISEQKQPPQSQSLRQPQSIYFADLMNTNQANIHETYKTVLKKKPNLLQYNINKHEKPKSISHHPLATGTNTISFQGLSFDHHTQLQFSIGAFIGQQESDGIIFKIVVQEGEHQDVVFERKLTQFNLWESYMVNVSQYAGKNVTIAFMTEPGGHAKYDQAIWGSPKIMTHAEYEVKDIGSAEQHKAIIPKYRDSQLASTEQRVDRGWFAEALTTDILLFKVQKDTIIRNEVYVLGQSGQKHEQLTLELLDEHDKVITSSIHNITTKQQRIFDEYLVEHNTLLPVKVRIRLESENPSRVFIKEPVLYSRRDEQATPPQYNVILMSLDTLRADRLSCYGYSRETSPNIDALAAESLIFTNAYSNSNWTLPAHTSLFTSLLPSQHKIVMKKLHTFNFYSPEWPYYYMTEAFKEAKYVTLAFTGGGWVSSRYGFNKRFDYYIENTRWTLSERDIEMWLHSIERYQNIPFFMFFHTYEIHEYYHERPNHHTYINNDFQRNTIPWFSDDTIRLHEIVKFLAGGEDTGNPVFDKIFDKVTGKILPVEGIHYVQDLYDGSIWYTDTLLGKFFEELKQMGLYDNTWIILTSDHGEGLGEIHNNNKISSWHHAYRLYDDQTRIPLIIKPPQELMQTFSSERTIEHVVQIIDIAPTLLAILGYEPHQQFVGNDLMKIFSNPNLNPEEPVFIDDLGKEHFAVIYNQYKLIAKLKTRTFSTGRIIYELYDLRRDNAENVNLMAKQHAVKYAPIFNELKELLAEHVQQTLRQNMASNAIFPTTPSEPPKPELEDVDQEQLQQLKDLGYL